LGIEWLSIDKLKRYCQLSVVFVDLIDADDMGMVERRKNSRLPQESRALISGRYESAPEDFQCNSSLQGAVGCSIYDSESSLAELFVKLEAAKNLENPTRVGSPNGLGFGERNGASAKSSLDAAIKASLDLLQKLVAEIRCVLRLGHGLRIQG